MAVTLHCHRTWSKNNKNELSCNFIYSLATETCHNIAQHLAWLDLRSSQKCRCTSSTCLRIRFFTRLVLNNPLGFGSISRIELFGMEDIPRNGKSFRVLCTIRLQEYVWVDYRKIVPGGQPLYSAWVELLSPDFKLWSLTELLVPSLAEPALMAGCRKSHRSCPHRTLAGCPQSLSFLALCQAAHPHLWLQTVSNRSSIHCCARKQCQCPICHRPCKFGICRWFHTSVQCSQSSKELAFQPMLVLCQYNLRLLRP